MHLDWLHGVLIALLPVLAAFALRAGKAIGTRSAQVLRENNYPLAAQLLEAVIQGVEDAGDERTKAAVRQVAEARGVQAHLAPIVESVTNGTGTLPPASQANPPPSAAAGEGTSLTNRSAP